MEPPKPLKETVYCILELERWLQNNGFPGFSLYEALNPYREYNNGELIWFDIDYLFNNVGLEEDLYNSTIWGILPPELDVPPETRKALNALYRVTGSCRIYYWW